MNVIIIGAGMAGLLAANMLRNHSVTVAEKENSLPNNHHALLRFRSDVVSRELRIPFRRVTVFKEVSGGSNRIADANCYARKVLPGSRVETRSIIDVSPGERWIAPLDLVKKMAAPLDILFGNNLEYESGGGFYMNGESAVRMASALRCHSQSSIKETGSATCCFDGHIISTIPMPMMMEMMGYSPRPEFKTATGYVQRFRVPGVDLYQTIYFPGPETLFYRVSITGDRVLAESMDPRLLLECPSPSALLPFFGLEDMETEDHELKIQPYAKINRLDERGTAMAENFMRYLTEEFNIYSLGRYATWRAGLLLDDLVKDVNRIERWMNGNDYQRVKEG